MFRWFDVTKIGVLELKKFGCMLLRINSKWPKKRRTQRKTRKMAKKAAIEVSYHTNAPSRNCWTLGCSVAPTFRFFLCTWSFLWCEINWLKNLIDSATVHNIVWFLVGSYPMSLTWLDICFHLLGLLLYFFSCISYSY